MDKKAVAYYLGRVSLITAIAMVIPMVIALCCKEDTWFWFLPPIGISLLIGILFSNRKWKGRNIYAREGFAITGFTWILMPLIGALPFFLSGKIPVFTDALFETVSGFTTTGSSILKAPSELGYGLLFWRSFSHFIGGMGVLVLLLCLLPNNGSGYNMQIMKAESPGPSVSKLVPKVRDTAKVLYQIYIVMTVLCILSYWISGMSFFDAVCIGVGTAGTGGFSIRDTGVSEYNTVSQALISFWMFMFSINFSLYFLIITGKGKEIFKSEELKFYIGINLFAVLFIGLMIFITENVSPFTALHEAVFTTTSTLSSTGFTMRNYTNFPASVKAFLILLMYVGAMAGSTGGGFKVSRVVLLLKETARELHMLIHPNAIKHIHMDGERVESSVLHSVKNYLIIYLLILVLSVFLISFDGFDFDTNLSAVMATLNNIGPGFSAAGENFADFSIFSKIILIFDMIAGRLELIPILMLFYPRTWKKHF